MDTFWLIAAGLVVIVAAITMFGVLPHMTRKPDNAGGSSSTLVRAQAIVGGLAILPFAAFMYLAWSNPHAQPDKMQDISMGTEHVEVINDLASRLQKNPEDGRGWAMLARAYTVMGRYVEAVEAYEKAARLLPTDAVVLIDYADVLAMINGKNMQGKPVELIRQALKIDPGNVKGLALMGTAAFQSGDFKRAEVNWGKLLPMLPPDSPLAKQIKAGIDDAQASGKQTMQRPAQTQPVSGGARVSGVVKLSPKLSGKAAPTDTVFVFARAKSGPPIAVMRAQVRDLPITFVLDDSMAMMPEMKLSQYKFVTVSAKVSQSGSATQQSGDLKGEVSSVEVGAANVQVLIDRIVP